MAHHVAVGEIQDDDIIVPGFDALHAFLTDLRGAHLRLEVIGGHLGRGDQHPVPTGEDGLTSAVEEEGDVGVFLRLGDAELGHAHFAEVLAQAVVYQYPGERHLHIGHGGVVLRVADIGQGEELPGKAVELGVHQGPGDLPGPVRAEIEEDDAVVVGDGPVGITDHRFHKFVGDALFIGLFYRVHRVGVVNGALAVDHGVIGLFHPVPTLVPVHGVITAHNRGDFAHADFLALGHSLSHEARAGGGGHVPSVQEGVNVDPSEPLVLRHLQEGEEVGQVGVNAAVGQEAEQVQGGALLQAGVHGVEIGGVLEKAAVLNGAGNPGQVLEDHPAAADVGVAHLAVAHLPVGQAHVQPGGGEGGVGELLEEFIQPGGFRGFDGVSRLPAAGAEAVHDNQSSRCFVHKQSPSLIGP